MGRTEAKTLFRPCWTLQNLVEKLWLYCPAAKDSVLIWGGGVGGGE